MKKKFLIEGMTCSSCVSLNRNTLEEIDGVSSVGINLATKQATVEYDETLTSIEKIQNAVKKNGFTVKNDEEITEKDRNSEDKIAFHRFIFSLIFSLPVFSMMFGDFMVGTLYFGVDLMMWIYMALSFIVVFIFGKHFHIGAFKSLLKMHFNMDTLVSLGTLTAFFYSIFAMFHHEHVYFEASVAIITLINLGKYLEYKAKTKAGDAIGKLLELGAKKATIKEGGKLVEKEIDNIRVGDIFIVKAGEKIALDGEILKGSANVEESMLTGESMPVHKQVGDECFGGTINLDGNLEIQVTKTNSEGTLAHIIQLVDQAQSSKAPIEHLTDKVAGIFVPIIIVIAIITFFAWYFTTGNISQALITSVACLVIACPCALGLATPTAIMVGTGVGAKNGILIKDAETLEKTKDIDVVVFDKTGTLTNAKPEVTDIISFTKDEETLLTFAGTLADLSHHPLSKSISKYTTDKKKYSVESFEEIKGKGLQAKIENEIVKLGNRKLFEKLIDSQIEKHLASFSEIGKTPIIIGTDTEIFGIIGLIDTEKEGVAEIIEELHRMNIEVYMLTGDMQKTADYIAKKIGIDKVVAEVMPGDKLSTIKNLQSQNKKVAFVGDGINDAPALVQADLSIAMGTGSDIAIESADIVLVKGNLQKVVSAIHLSRQTLRVIKENLFWAFLYNTIGIPLAAFGLLNPIFASFAMSMSSVSVISNSLRLKLFRK